MQLSTNMRPGCSEANAQSISKMRDTSYTMICATIIYTSRLVVSLRRLNCQGNSRLVIRASILSFCVFLVILGWLCHAY